MLFEKTVYEDDFPISIRILHVEEYPFHYHLDHEFVYVLEGCVRLKNGSGSYLLQEGDVFTNSGHEVHGLYADGAENTVAILQISNHFFSQYFPLLNKACFRTYVNHDKYRQLDTLRKMLLNILLHYVKRSFHYKHTCTEQMIDVIKYLKRCFNLFAFEDQVVVNFKSDNPVIVERISRIINYIYENHSAKLTLETLSEREHLSTFYLSHLVRDYMGISFQELLCFARVEMSEIPLLETDKKISTIARDAGFSTTSYYNKYFAKWFGHTPQEHRMLHIQHVLSREHPAKFVPLSENSAVSLLRSSLSALKDQENNSASVRQLLYRVTLPADAPPLKTIVHTPHLSLTLADAFSAGERLFPYLYELGVSKLFVTRTFGDDETSAALLCNRLRTMGFDVQQTSESNLPAVPSYGYDSIAYAVWILRDWFWSSQNEIFFRLRDPGQAASILKGMPACLTSALIPKPAFYACRMLQNLHGDLLYQDAHCFVLKVNTSAHTDTEARILVLINDNQEVLNLCSRNAGLHETRDVIRAFRDELQVDFCLSLPPGEYTIVQTAFSNENSIFSYLAQLEFPEQLSLPQSWQQLLCTEPQTQLRTETVCDALNITASISGAGIHVTMLQRSATPPSHSSDR